MKFISAVLFSLTLVGSAHANVTSYTSASSFNAASIGLTDFDFEGIVGPGEATFFPSGVTRGPLSFSATSIFVIDPGFGSGNPVAILSGQSASPPAPNPVTATLGGATAISFSFGSYLVSGLPLSVVVTAGSDAVFNLAMPASINTYNFVGFTSDTAITKVVLNSDSQDISVFDISRFQVGSIAPVPEPAAALMFGIGLALMGAIGRRRRA